MRSVANGLKTFFEGFDLPAYTRDNIPDDVTLPYITYDLTEPHWDTQGNLSCQVYYPKQYLDELLEKADEILAAIGEGVKIKTESGYLVLRINSKDRMSDSFSESVYILLTINSYHLPGE